MRTPSLKAADFQRALGTRPLARTAHFTLHALPAVSPEATGQPGLSTAPQLGDSLPVDECVRVEASGAWRLGLVLPKKQARRSVTRSLLRHQAREALRRHAPFVQAQGQFGSTVDGWVLRLKAPFDRQQFPSAASVALGLAVRAELDELWAKLSRPASVHKGAA